MQHPLRVAVRVPEYGTVESMGALTLEYVRAAQRRPTATNPNPLTYVWRLLLRLATQHRPTGAALYVRTLTVDPERDVVLATGARTPHSLVLSWEAPIPATLRTSSLFRTLLSTARTHAYPMRTLARLDSP